MVIRMRLIRIAIRVGQVDMGLYTRFLSSYSSSSFFLEAGGISTEDVKRFTGLPKMAAFLPSLSENGNFQIINL
ncbi:hypothetical protein [Bacillus sp. B-jedd]|uniref:hypothetical protein n=1 Tax=Bacillus sp. B-jedd TaxID=1476857 RepID=UPI001E4361C5|nr:hypothetical protein [Bacillus sp. B-jedd]